MFNIGEKWFGMLKSEETRWDITCDVIKIVAMLFIVICHALSYSGVQLSVWGKIIGRSSIISDNLFILVTGYLSGGKHKNLKLKKIIYLWLKAIVISWSIFLLMYIWGYKIRVGRNIIYTLFPIISGEYWFITVYIGLYLLMPFIDSYLISIDKKTHFKFCCILILIFSLFSSIPYSLEMGAYHGYSVCWFVVLYIVGNYIFKYVKHIDYKAKIHIGMILVVIIVEKTILHTIEFPISGLKEKIGDLNNILYFIESVLLFVLLTNIKISNNINKNIAEHIHKVAKNVLDVYLIHMQYDLKFLLWKPIILIPFLNEEINVIVYAIIVFIIMLFAVLVIKYAINLGINKFKNNYL